MDVSALIDQYGQQSTDALLVDPGLLISPLVIDINSIQRATLAVPNDNKLKREFEIHRLEAQIIICRHMLIKGEGDAAENESYIAAATKVYNSHREKMLRLIHISNKNQKFPIIPITFTQQETSELYWTLVNYGSIDCVIDQVEYALADKKSRLLDRLPSASEEECVTIRRGVEGISIALTQWRVQANAAVNQRARTIQCMCLREIAEERDMTAEQGADKLLA